jgi:hypothetical protein
MAVRDITAAATRQAEVSLFGPLLHWRAHLQLREPVERDVDLRACRLVSDDFTTTIQRETAARTDRVASVIASDIASALDANGSKHRQTDLRESLPASQVLNVFSLYLDRVPRLVASTASRSINRST